MALDVELAEIRDFLARHEPFAALADEVLDRLPARLAVEYVRAGTDIVARGRAADDLYVLRSGAAEVRAADGTLLDRGEAGASFAPAPSPGDAPSTTSVTAIEDSLLLVVPGEVFAGLCRDHPRFAAFYDEGRRGRMRGAVAELQVSASGSAILKTRLRDLVGRELVTVPVGATVRDAAELMAERRVSSVLVMDGERLRGILTDRDLRGRVLAAGVDTSAPVADVMTRDPVTGSVGALAFEALLQMTARHIHHLPLVDDAGRPAGIVTTTDLLRIEESNPVYLAGDIAKQDDVAGVAEVSARLPGVVRALVAQDATADDVGRVVTAVGDAVERRLIALAEAELGPAPVPYCWVTLGSRARLEQGLAADQDTAMILDDAAAEPDEAWFAALADRVVDGLERCGYPRCRGEVMATNPRWRRPLAHWRRDVSSWLAAPTPEAVLHSSIFFDMRPVHGDATLHSRLQEQVLRDGPAARTFLAHLAKQAGSHEPPLGFFRGFVLEKEGEHRDTLDIKRGAILAVVELARVHALAVGSPAVNTRARLEAARTAGALSQDLADDLRDAFEFVGYVRLRHQSARIGQGREPDNFVAPDDLSGFEKRHLREAFSIIRFAQQALGRRYLTALVS